jgi:hypothetical protein
LQLRADRFLVARQVARELHELTGDHKGNAPDDGAGQRYGEHDGRDLGQAQAPEPQHQGREREAQEDREREGHEDVAAEVETADREHDAAGRENARSGRGDHDDRGRGSGLRCGRLRHKAWCAVAGSDDRLRRRHRGGVHTGSGLVPTEPRLAIPDHDRFRAAPSRSGKTRDEAVQG